VAECQPGESVCPMYGILLARADLVGDEFQHLIVLRKPVGFQLGEDRFIIDGKLEAPAITWFQGNIREVLVVLVNE
jgi:hypothetical protein